MLSYLPIVTALLAVGPAMAHMELNSPYPLRSKFDPANDWSHIDYSMTSPLLADGSNFPCKGYHTDNFRATAFYSAGSTYEMSLTGTATHNGGSCQISLSYDNGATFKVIKSMLGGCPLTLKYDFVIPSEAPNGRALLAWTWFNLTGNREMYMNCANVEVINNAGDAAKFSARPNIFVANVNNGCATVEWQQTVFANPGDKVIYADGVTSSNPAYPVC
ncbi:hypothetical protein V501_00781 [Pseudogymnoascus sp. VKM F-4519 (FW-2642)]|nr:hypothetical protein V501_00781 [Pseudogymnoascus sp. VKM F-4519 (FW-2642)]